MSNFDLFGNNPKSNLKISSSWASKKIDCTINGICNGCKGNCCTTGKNKSFYPAKANGGVCFYLKEGGCELSLQDRPIKCLLYPFVINENNTLVLYGRAITSTCKENYNKTEVTIFENLQTNLIALFGEEQYFNALNNLVNGKPAHFTFSDDLLKQLEVEKDFEQKNLVPIKRTTILKNNP